jgi:hypothetical protein
VEAGDGRVPGFGVERGGALGCDLADEVEGGGDVGLGGPDGELDDRRFEGGGELGEGLVVIEPGAEALFVQGAQFWDLIEHARGYGPGLAGQARRGGFERDCARGWTPIALLRTGTDLPAML